MILCLKTEYGFIRLIAARHSAEWTALDYLRQPLLTASRLPSRIPLLDIGIGSEPAAVFTDKTEIVVRHEALQSPRSPFAGFGYWFLP